MVFSRLLVLFLLSSGLFLFLHFTLLYFMILCEFIRNLKRHRPQVLIFAVLMMLMMVSGLLSQKKNNILLMGILASQPQLTLQLALVWLV